MKIDPLDVRVRELWKMAAISSIENNSSDTAINRADLITIAFLERFYTNDPEGLKLKQHIQNPKRLTP